jgi:hypothetical protein
MARVLPAKQARRWVRRMAARVAGTLAAWWLDPQRGNFEVVQHRQQPRAPLITKSTVWGTYFIAWRRMRAVKGVGRPPAVTLHRWGRRIAA